MSGLTIAQLLDELDEAARRGLIEESGSPVGRFRFVHALVRDAVYQQIAPLRRAQFHRDAAEALASLPEGRPSERLAEIAFHFAKSSGLGRDQRIAEYGARAAAQASHALAFERAEAIATAAMRALEGTDLLARNWRLIAERARAASGLGTKRDSLPWIKLAFDAAEAACSERGIVVCSRLLTATPDEDMQPFLDRALKVVSEGTRPAALTAAYYAGHIAERAPVRAEALSGHGRRWLESNADPEVEVAYRIARCNLNFHRGLFAKLIEDGEALLASGIEAPVAGRDLMGHRMAGTGCIGEGDLAGVERHGWEMREPARAISRHWSARAVDLIAIAALCRGDWESFDAILHEPEHDPNDPVLFGLQQLAAAERGELQELERLIAAVPAYDIAQNSLAPLFPRAARALAALHAGEPSVVLGFEPGSAKGPMQNAFWDVMGHTIGAFSAAACKDEEAAAQSHYVLSRHPAFFCWWRHSWHAMGLASAVCGEFNRAIAELGRAREFYAQGFRVGGAWCAFDLASALIERNQAADSERATELLLDAHGTAAELGLRELVRRSEGTLAKLNRAVARATPEAV
ncbi:MAG: hypothetical protein IPH65_04430 [Dehalococcoidia bacterium]|uniref:hypothetical protein n=1 Tax=Candidatus Amarobacter glycogenicus TaxID=3140699 RepID=UPI003135854F|nr:hypothetical protein [Dehalococcoidia bacterium]